MPLAITSSTPVVRAGLARRRPEEVGSWGAARRDRKGHSVGERMEINGRQYPIESGLARWLTFPEMWTVYRRVADLRAAIDSIVRRVATWDWFIEVQAKPGDDAYEAAEAEAEQIRRFLAAPNSDGETWQELLTKAMTDLLVFDQTAIELVRSRDGKLRELVALRGSSVSPKIDDLGRIKGYVQHYATDDGGFASDGKAVQFKPEEVVFIRLFPTTAGAGGNSLIEAIVDEVITILNAARHSMLAFDADEIPPGILVLTGLAGKAAQKAQQDMEEYRGKDHKIRVITTPDPSNAGARWVELRRTPKDLTMREVVRDIKFTIWRTFGVLPIEMGETENVPRASAEIQLEIGSSHLVNPILELIESKVNARILPLIVSDERFVGEVMFRFDTDSKLSPEQEKQRQEMLVGYVDAGVMTRNEARDALGYGPETDYGDIFTVAKAIRRLEDALGGDDEQGEPGDDDGEAEPEEPETEPETPGESEPEDGEGTGPEEEAPGENDGEKSAPSGPLQVRAAHRARVLLGSGLGRDAAVSQGFTAALRGDSDRRGLHGILRCECDHGHPEGWGDTFALVQAGTVPANLALLIDAEASFRAAGDLPSDWQPTGRFRSYRTLNLTTLGNIIGEYARTVRPYWRTARDEVVAAIGRSYDAKLGGLSDEGIASVNNAVADALDKLTVNWRAGTGHLYERAAEVGRNAAVDFSGSSEASSDWKAKAETYYQLAIGYLTAAEGPLETVKRAVNEHVRKARRDALAGVETRAGVDDAIAGIVDEAVLLASVEAAFNGQEFRLYHWSGKLNELSNETLLAGLDQVRQAEGETGAVQWWAEWVYVGDRATCGTCEREGLLGARPVDQMSVKPGGDTECRGNCRCVLVFWTEDEIKSGSWVRLGPTEPAA